ncbi:MAG: hypothetical protein BGO76_02305 [Caedibacter sp. 38-128]|nr:hypothetical protein [Holosporales bacterium]OJX08569.1 MAG: hypothetical protein BGO76_02305 [Caedibacter sp. 38-128]
MKILRFDTFKFLTILFLLKFAATALECSATEQLGGMYEDYSQKLVKSYQSESDTLPIFRIKFDHISSKSIQESVSIARSISDLLAFHASNRPELKPPFPITDSTSQQEASIVSQATPLMNRVHLKKVPSIFLYALGHATNNPLKLNEWRVYTTNKQSFEDLPLKIKEKSTPWFSPLSQNLYATFCFSFTKNQFNKVFFISQIASVSIAQVLENYGLPVQIRWPNDILVNNRKIAGIGGKTDFFDNVSIFINVGLNINMSKYSCNTVDQPATSMMVEKMAVFDNEVILTQLANQLHDNVEILLKENFKTHFLPYIQQHTAYIGEHVILKDKTLLHEGVFLKLNEYGHIILSIDKQEKDFISGSLRRKTSTSTSSASMLPPDEEDPNEKKERKKPTIKTKKYTLQDEQTLDENEALDAAIDFLGEGYEDMGNGRFKSVDSLRQIRMGNKDLLGEHADGPHINFEEYTPSTLRIGKYDRINNLHIYLK